MEFSYKDGEDFVFSDPETYETVTLPPEIVGDAKNYLVENAPGDRDFCRGQSRDDRTAAERGAEGDRRAGRHSRRFGEQRAEGRSSMETGITVQAPLFIKTGEKIKIDTRTGKYMERA